MATNYKGSSFLEILKGVLDYMNFCRIKIMECLIETIIKSKLFVYEAYWIL